MKALTRMWFWGFVAGVFLMAAINGVASVVAGNVSLGWVQIVGGVVVVAASVATLLNTRRTDE